MGSDAKRRGIGQMLPYLLPAPAVGVIALAAYAWHQDSGSVFANAVLVAGCAFAIGGLLGFLFGIPRSPSGDPGRAVTTENSSAGSDAPTRTGYESNTNLEQISDWLTKILVGVGLVELGKLDTTVRHLGAALAPAFGNAPSSETFALATCFLYAVTGFLIIYLATRV